MKKLCTFLSLAIILLTSCTPKMRGETDIKISEVPYNKSGLPIVEEPLSIKIGVQTKMSEQQVREGEYKVFDLMEERTGVKIDWEIIPENNLVAKIILMFVSNTYPEAFYGMYNSSADWQRMIDQGFIIPLDPYVEAGLMPNLEAKLKAKPELLNGLVMADGHFYSLPRYTVPESPYGINETIHLNEKWMDALNLEDPENLNELYDVLVAFRDGDPNGNGEKDEIPFTAIWNSPGSGLWPLFGAFGLHDNYWIHRMVREGRVICPNIQPEYKQAILYFKKLYSEGLLDIEFFSQDQAMFDSKIRNDQVGFWMEAPIPNSYGLTHENTVEDLTERARSIGPLKGLNGEDPIWPVHGLNTIGSLEITNKCKNPEILLRWADQFYDDDYGMQLLYGAWGQYMHDAGDGKVRLIDPVEEFEIQTITFPTGPQITLEDRILRTELELYSRDVWDRYAPYRVKEVFLNYAYTKDDNRRVASIVSDTKKLIDNKQIAWITGEADINEEWDWYLKELEKMGINELFEIYQKYYDGYLNSRK